MSAGCKHITLNGVRFRGFAGRSLILACLLLITFTGTAQAHGAFSGPPGFVTGLSHPFSVPAHILAITAMALLCGQQGFVCLKRTLAGFTLAIASGLLLTQTGLTLANIEIILLAVAGLTGLLVALKWSPVPRLMIFATLLTTLLVGLDSGLVTDNLVLTAATLSGTALAATILYLYLTAVTAIIYKDRPEWMQIGVRVAGSWISAISALVIALFFAG